MGLGHALLGASWLVKKCEGDVREAAHRLIPYLSCGLFVFLIVVFIYSLTGKLEPNWFENRLFSANVTMPSGTFSWHLHSADYTKVSRIGVGSLNVANSFPRFAMAAPIPLRPDFKAPLLRKLARGSRDPDQIRRLLALAEIYDGGSRSDAARIGGVGLQIVRDWVLWFNAEGPDGLVNGKAPGAPSLLNDHQRQALRQVVEDGPMPALHGVVRWRLIDLAHWLFEEFRISISKQTLSRELRNMGFRKLSARPRHHAQDEEAAAGF